MAGGQRAAAISYRVLFSLVPFVALLVSVLELVLPETTQAERRLLARRGRVPARRARRERGRGGRGCGAAGVRHGRRRTRRADLGRERDDGLRALGVPGGLGQRGRSALSARQAARLRARSRSRRARRLCLRALPRRPGGHAGEQRDRRRSSAAGSPRRPASVRSRSSAPRSPSPCSPSRCSIGSSRRCRCASGTSCPARSWPPSACIWRARASRSTSTASAASTTSTGRSAPCWRSCCWCTSQPSSCSSARALPPPGRRPRPSRPTRRTESGAAPRRLVAPHAGSCSGPEQGVSRMQRVMTSCGGFVRVPPVRRVPPHFPRTAEVPAQPDGLGRAPPHCRGESS